MTKDQQKLLAVCAQCVRNIDWPYALNISVEVTPFGPEAWVCKLLRNGKGTNDVQDIMIADCREVVERKVRGIWQLADSAKFLFVGENGYSGGKRDVHIPG